MRKILPFSFLKTWPFSFFSFSFFIWVLLITLVEFASKILGLIARTYKQLECIIHHNHAINVLVILFIYKVEGKKYIFFLTGRGSKIMAWVLVLKIFCICGETGD